MDQGFHRSRPGIENLGGPAGEPLLPVEKKLIGWSLALGVILIFVLVAISEAFFGAPGW